MDITMENAIVKIDNKQAIINMNDLIQLVNVTQKQSMTQNMDGTWLFTPNAEISIHESEWDMTEVEKLRSSMLKSAIGFGANKSILEYTLTLIERDGVKIAIAKPFMRVNLINTIGKRTTLSTHNSAVIRASKVISDAKKGQRYTAYAICRELANMDDKSILNELNFKTVAQFAKAVFDIETSTANLYCRIGKSFICYDGVNDEYYMSSSLIPPVSISYLLELVKLVPDNGDLSEIENLFLNGTLNESFSTSKVRKIVKEYCAKKDAIISVEESTESADDVTESADDVTESADAEISATESATESAETSDEESAEASVDPSKSLKKAINAMTKALNEFVKVYPTKKDMEISWNEYVEVLLKSM